MKKEYNFLTPLSKEEKQLFRKRMIGMILATDMARHAADVSAFKAQLEAKMIKGGNNSDLILNKES